jgi:hypothetical protein
MRQSTESMDEFKASEKKGLEVEEDTEFPQPCTVRSHALFKNAHVAAVL